MAKAPRSRHSKPTGEPPTIDSTAEVVVDEPDAAETNEIAAEAATSEQVVERTEEIDHVAAETEIPGDPPPRDDPPAPVTPPVRQKAGIASLLGAGLVGGLIAAGGNWALSYFNPATPPADQLPDFAAEFSTRDNRIAALSDTLGQVQKSVGDLQQAVATIKPAEAPDLSAFDLRIGELERKIADLKVSGGDPAALERLATIDAKLASLDASIAAAGDAARAASETAGAQAARIDALAATVKAVEEKAAAAAGNPRIALAIAAAALKSAVDRGLPFMTELETYAAVAPDAPEIAQLRAFAASGVPTRADLAIAAGEAVNAMIAAVNASNPDAGFLQSLLDSAKALVTVRPIGMVEGEGVDAIAARMEARTKTGDLAGALEEISKAPDAARAAAADFSAKVQARISVETLIDAALAQALASGAAGG
jgi:hypothetical protein